MDYRDRLYKHYASQHTSHLYGEASAAGICAQFPFDLYANRVNKVVVEGREFIVTLNKIISRSIPEVSKALEYEFGVAETNP